MNDRMIPIPFDKLVTWVLSEYEKEHSIFGISAGKFYRKTGGGLLPVPGGTVENPIGPAAGPHTQLAQNIIAAYLAGARYFELKTVQTLDGEDLPVSKPCILARDEGYNVEWSTELTVQDAFNEYVKAYFMLNVLSRELGLGASTGFVFNMSVGYDLTGIRSPKIDAFIEGLKDASETPVWKECTAFLLGHPELFKNIDAAFVGGISPIISASITLSTLHGCPPQEIERIARYLLGEKKLNVLVKCNPTLLGYDFARRTLDALGYDYLSFDDHHFKNDLQYGDAVPMLQRLQAYAGELGLDFGVKLTNTFPVRIENKELPGEEMYMSGRALYPLTVSLAARLAETFGGDLRISYSGGADFFGLGDILKTGIAPVTLATTLLKSGGYARLHQLAELADGLDLPFEFTGVSVSRLKALADNAMKDAVYQKDFKETENRKLSKTVPLTDCFIAPCKTGCPIGQDVPEYIRLYSEGRFAEAFDLITSKNPFPFTTGTICAHPCRSKCTRMDYDQSVDIRAAKLAAAEKGYDAAAVAEKTPVKDGSKAAVTGAVRTAIVGGGPAGLSAAYFLAESGFDVTVLDKRESIGGLLTHVIPEFRLPAAALARDLALIRKTGVSFRLGVGDFSIEAMRKEGFKYIFIATGAWKPGEAGFETDGDNVLDVLDFLEKFKNGSAGLTVGKHVAVVGAGNSAMDAARAAKRLPGVENVTIVYRRTQKLAPADREELHSALEDGVVFRELLTPASYHNGVLRCRKLTLGAPDASGRRSPVPLEGQFEEIAADTVISAVGQRTDDGPLLRNGIALDKKGRIRANPETNETSLEDVFAGGDLVRGPATVVEAIADGRKFADTVLEREGLEPPALELAWLFNKSKQALEIDAKKGVLERSCKGESGKCLECNTVCNICVEVCPNRANVAVTVGGMRNPNQVLHLDGMCNACGNCEAFCPYESAPYKDKLTLYRTGADFDAGENSGFWVSDADTGRIKARVGDRLYEGTVESAGLPDDITAIIRTVLREYRHIVY
jgi:putative selenate reductase